MLHTLNVHTNTHTDTHTSSGLVVSRVFSVQLEVCCGEPAPLTFAAHTHTHRQPFTHMHRATCAHFTNSLSVFVCNRWELMVLPSRISFRENCQIKMSLQSSFYKAATCSWASKHKYGSKLLTSHTKQLLIMSTHNKVANHNLEVYKKNTK